MPAMAPRVRPRETPTPASPMARNGTPVDAPSVTRPAPGAAGQLVLALFVLASAPRSPLAIALALLCLDIAGWNAATLANEIAPHDAFHFVDHALSSFTAPLALDFVLLFVGARRSSRL